MDETSLASRLSGLPLGGIRYFDSIGSTNDEALAWVEEGASDLSLVIADEQTAGRGRLKRKWLTPRGTALAFSLILHAAGRSHLTRTVGAAALAISDACSALGLDSTIKWPNDLLLNGRKVAGILIETHWSGDLMKAFVIGMGVNVLKRSTPPPEELQFPAISIEEALGSIPDREELIREILSAFLSHLAGLSSDEFLATWERKLAYRGEQVQVRANDLSPITGELLGLEADGALRLRDEHGHHVLVHAGDLSLRPVT
jgi:BirA family biotin operon repressor/biotin-[acetyl-CoA-carboxylase] ligase